MGLSHSVTETQPESVHVTSCNRRCMLLYSSWVSVEDHPCQQVAGVRLMWRMQVLPGGRLLASSDETGNVAVADLRMLGSTRQPMLWQVIAHDTDTLSRQRKICMLLSIQG